MLLILRGQIITSHSLYLHHLIQNDNRDLYFAQLNFNLVSRCVYSAHETNEVVSHYDYLSLPFRLEHKGMDNMTWTFCLKKTGVNRYTKYLHLT